MTAVSTHGRGPAEGELSSGKCTSLDYCALDRQNNSSVNKSHLPLDLCLGMARTGSLLPCLRALSKWQRCSRAIIGAEPAWKAREGFYSDYTRPGLPRLLSCQMPSVCTVRQGFNPRSLSCLLPPESKD